MENIPSLCKKKTTNVVNVETKMFPLEEQRREFFGIHNTDNSMSTDMTIELAQISVERWIIETTNKKKVIWWILIISDREYSYDHLFKETKKSLVGMLAVNNFAESLFASVSTWVQVFSQTKFANAATTNDVKHIGFLRRNASTKTEKGTLYRDLFSCVSKVPRITAVITTIKYAPETRAKNTMRQISQQQNTLAWDKLRREIRMSDASNECTKCLNFHQIGELEVFWTTPKQVKDEVKAL